MHYIGATEPTFKSRYNNHTQSFRNIDYCKDSTLSTYIWTLKHKNIDYKIDWQVITRANGFKNGSKSCNLCLTEKYYILKCDKTKHTNKKSELISTCRHVNKFVLKNHK